MEPFINRMRSIIEGIKRAPNIKVLKLDADTEEIDQATMEMVFSKIEERAGIKLDVSFNDYLFMADELSLCWDYELDDDEDNGGEFRLINLLNVFALKPQMLWTEDMAEKEQQLLRKHYPFDDHPVTGDGAMGTFKIEPGANDPEVWFFKMPDERYRMDLTYREYLDCLLETRGYFEWQYLFCDVDIKRHPTDLAGRLEKMLQDLPKLYPETDFTKYDERFKALNKKQRRK
jgi:hypothetical protein